MYLLVFNFAFVFMSKWGYFSEFLFSWIHCTLDNSENQTLTKITTYTVGNNINSIYFKYHKYLRMHKEIRKTCLDTWLIQGAKFVGPYNCAECKALLYASITPSIPVQ
jgi:hypothetical protein